MIADMFLPQRATLFGYAVLFPTLWLLYRAVFREHKEFFLIAGLFASALPMIHTHSFLSAGIISAVWLLLWLMRQTAQATIGKSSNFAPAPCILAAFVILMCFLQKLKNAASLTSNMLVLLGVSLFVIAVFSSCILLCNLNKHTLPYAGVRHIFLIKRN